MEVRGPSAMPCAFAVVQARAGSSLPDDLADRFVPVTSRFPFEARAHLRWADRSGRTVVVAWQGTTDTPHRWMVDGDGVVLTAGRLRRRRQRWTSPARWAADAAARLRREPVDDVVDSLTGTFHLLHLDGSGRGVLASDPVGYAYTFHAETDDLTVVASDVGLAAAAVTPAGQRPTRDALALAWLTYLPYHIGLDTGFAGVHLLREGTTVHFQPDEPTRIEQRPAPWLHPGRLASLDRDALLDHIVEEVADELDAALHLDADDRYVDLTGGLDSRLVLAVALEAGLAHRVRFATFGPETLRDVQVARQIAALLDLDHRWGLDGGATGKTDYDEDLRRFLAPTGGLVSVWHAKRWGPPTGRVRISGSFGEALRTHRPVDGRVPSIVSLARRQARRVRRRGLPLLRADLADRLDAAIMTEASDDPVGRSDPLDLFETFFIRNRTRKFWGSMLLMERDERIWPLVNVETTRAAFALGGADRQMARVHYDIVRRASEPLAAVPFAGPGWSSGLLDRTRSSSVTGPDDLDADRTDAENPVDPDERDESTSERRGRSEPLIALMRRTSTAERTAFLADVLHDEANPAWELLDRQVAVDSLDQWGSLPSRHRQQVFGALTTALWLGDDGW